MCDFRVIHAWIANRKLVSFCHEVLVWWIVTAPSNNSSIVCVLFTHFLRHHISFPFCRLSATWLAMFCHIMRPSIFIIHNYNCFPFSFISFSLFSLQDLNEQCPYSLSPVSIKSQKLLRSPRKATRKISRIPFKVLDAPELQDDFYLNLVDWSAQNVLAVGLGSCVYLWSACTSQVSKISEI